jgi:hypothetical protein
VTRRIWGAVGAGIFWALVFAGLLYVRALHVSPCERGDIVCQEDQ